MGALAMAPYAAAAALLLVGGVAKLLRPADTARALAASGLGRSELVVRVAAAAEAALGLLAVLDDQRWPAAMLAASYACFTAFVLAARRRNLPIATCGCFGVPDTPPTVTHAVVTAAAAACGAAVAADPGRGVLGVVGTQPLAGLPWILLTATVAGLGYAALTSLARLEGARHPAAQRSGGRP
ncbi:MAG: MauE/DoxX family redox-associated membrane protein [Acidimicrobiales bacterium]